MWCRSDAGRVLNSMLGRMEVKIVTIAERLFAVAANLSKDADIAKDAKRMSPLDKLADCAEIVGKSSSQSWLGYHSKVYYADLNSPPPGAHFSREWGLMDMRVDGTTGDWREYAYDDVIEAIMQCAKHPDLAEIERQSASARERFDEEKGNVLSALGPV